MANVNERGASVAAILGNSSRLACLIPRLTIKRARPAPPAPHVGAKLAMRSSPVAVIVAAMTCGAFLLRSAAAPPIPAEPLPPAHSHNDYQHPRPLLDALELGFCNIEADVFLVGKQLLVGHDKEDLRPDRTLERLYLEPLRQLIEQRDGRLFADGQRLTLLIDFKSAGPPTYAALSELLRKYEGILSGFQDGAWRAGQVDVIISGDRPTELIAQDEARLAAVDGRLDDLAADPPAALIPLVSDNWNDHFTWRGEGPMPDAEREKLGMFVKEAHGQGRRLRFWATPDSPDVWRELQAAGVDVIGCDDLAALHAFLTTSD
jgi:hypothetical protein